MAEIITGANPRQIAVGNPVKLKHQVHCPIMTVSTLQMNVRPDQHSNAVINLAVCQWFDEGGILKALQCELSALEPYTEVE